MRGPPGRWPSAGSSPIADLDQPAVVVVGQLLGEDLAGDRDGQVGGLRPDLDQGLVAGVGDLALGPLRGRPRPRPGPCWRIASAVACGLACGPPRSGRGPGRRPGPARRRCSASSRSASFRARSDSSRTCSRCSSRSCRAFSSGFQANLPRTSSRPRKTTTVQIASGGWGSRMFGLRLGRGRGRGVVAARSASAASPGGLRRRRRGLGAASWATAGAAGGPNARARASEPEGQDRLPGHGCRPRDPDGLGMDRGRTPGRPAARRRAGAAAGRSGRRRSAGSVAMMKQDDDQREERHALDQRGRDDHGRLDVAGRSRAGGPCSRRPTRSACRCPARRR